MPNKDIKFIIRLFYYKIIIKFKINYNYIIKKIIDNYI